MIMIKTLCFEFAYFEFLVVRVYDICMALYAMNFIIISLSFIKKFGCYLKIFCFHIIMFFYMNLYACAHTYIFVKLGRIFLLSLILNPDYVSKGFDLRPMCIEKHILK